MLGAATGIALMIVGALTRNENAQDLGLIVIAGVFGMGAYKVGRRQ